MMITSKYIDANIDCELRDLMNITTDLKIIVNDKTFEVSGNLKNIFNSIVKDKVYTLYICDTHVGITVYGDTVTFYNIYGVTEQNLEPFPGYLYQLEKCADEIINERYLIHRDMIKDGIISEDDEIAFCDFCDSVIINGNYCEHCDCETLMPSIKF